MLARIRRFFARRGVLEVETPLLSAATVTDLHLSSLRCRVSLPGGSGERYLQTSPEFAMKRLLAAGSGPIYQITRAFRDEEAGRLHNPEFTILEWYRPGYDHHQLMDEMEALLAEVLAETRAESALGGSAERLAWNQLFTSAQRFGWHLEGDPHHASARELQEAARDAGLETQGLEGADRDTWLALLFTHLVEPHLGRGRATFVYDYPASQAALARVRPGDPPLAERFEVYLQGVELANGFHELTDPEEQRQRFMADLELRRQRGLPEVAIDEQLLAALEAGLPPSAGVALGVDRLAMLAAGATSLAEVSAFPIDRA